MRLDDLADEACAWCGKEYMPRMVWQKYCCEECRRASIAAFHKQVTKTRLAALRCVRCGEPILGVKKTSALYCGITCQCAAKADRKFGSFADLRCVDCGGPIPNAGKRTATLCAGCTIERHRKLNRERARKARLSRTITNQGV